MAYLGKALRRVQVIPVEHSLERAQPTPAVTAARPQPTATQVSAPYASAATANVIPPSQDPAVVLRWLTR
jgi:hypothetical protein